jgi:hypothetical protein
MSSCPTRCEGVSEAASRSAQEVVRVGAGDVLVVVVGLVVVVELVGLAGVVVGVVVAELDCEAVLLGPLLLVASGCPPPVQAAARSARDSADAASTRGG